MEPLHSFFECFFFCFKKGLHRLQFSGEGCDACFAVRHSQWRGMGGWREGNRERWWGSTVCRQHLLHSERPLSPPLSHNPLLLVNTTEERSHTRQQVTLPWLITIPHVCSHTHVNSVVFWVYADVLVIIMRMTNSTWMSLKMCLFFAHEDFETSLWAGACQLYCDIILLVPLKVTSASSLHFQRCCPWLPRLFASRALERATD